MTKVATVGVVNTLIVFAKMTKIAKEILRISLLLAGVNLFSENELREAGVSLKKNGK